VRGRLTTIAMAPVNISFSMMSQTDARATFEPTATERLERTGFKVIPSEVWEDLWNQSASDVGGIFDVSTGAVDEERFDLVRESVYQTLESEYDVHAVLYLAVEIDDYYNPGSTFYFCATRGEVYFPTDGSLQRNFSLDVTLARAACLVARLYDMERRFLYGVQSGLEVIETFAEQTRAVRPKSERLKDPDRIKEALEAVIGPLADGAGPQTEE